MCRSRRNTEKLHMTYLWHAGKHFQSSRRTRGSPLSSGRQHSVYTCLSLRYSPCVFLHLRSSVRCAQQERWRACQQLRRGTRLIEWTLAPQTVMWQFEPRHRERSSSPSQLKWAGIKPPKHMDTAFNLNVNESVLRPDSKGCDNLHKEALFSFRLNLVQPSSRAYLCSAYPLNEMITARWKE